MNKPLEGIRVLTLEQFGAGPYGTMFLAELGAEVIKVEAPEGDPSRQVGPYRLGKDDSEYFQAWNLGKKSVTVDLKSSAGRKQFEALVKGADCVVIVTEWNEFRRPDFDRIKKLLASPVIFDGRNLFTPEQMRQQGFTYYSIGRQ